MARPQDRRASGPGFGAGLLWTVAFTTPLMIAIQLVSARIGWLTGQGLAASFRRVMPLRHRVLGWLATAIMAGALVAMIVV